MPLRPRIPFDFSRRLDVTKDTRNLVERTLFMALARDKCPEHARYSVDRYVVTVSRNVTTAHFTRCCPPDDDSLQMYIDAAPSVAAANEAEVLSSTAVPPGAGFDLSTFVSIGFLRRRRAERLTLEVMWTLRGAERLRDEQIWKLKVLLADESARGKLMCSAHGDPAIQAIHVVPREDATVVHLEVCCWNTNATLLAAQKQVDEAILSGPVVAIGAGKLARRRKKP